MLPRITLDVISVCDTECHDYQDDKVPNMGVMSLCLIASGYISTSEAANDFSEGVVD